jgi:hypothetical protein
MRRSGLAGVAAAVSVTVLLITLSGCGSSATSTSTSTAGSGGPGSPSRSATTVTTTTPAATTPGAGGLRLPHATLTVKPTTGGPTSVLHFSFQAPAASGRQGTTAASYTLSAVGPHGSGCVGAETMALPAVTRDQTVTAALSPATSGGRWCAGTYVARADELERPICSAGQMCPQFARLVAVVGPVTFRIRR